MIKKDRDILNFIQIIRRSFSDAPIIYKWGACYGFYEIMKDRFRDSEAYCLNGTHILTKLGEDYWDIDGYYQLEEGEDIVKMDEYDHFRCSSWRDGQRVETMLKKYNKS